MMLDMTRLVNNEEVSDHTALLPTKSKAKVGSWRGLGQSSIVT